MVKYVFSNMAMIEIFKYILNQVPIINNSNSNTSKMILATTASKAVDTNSITNSESNGIPYFNPRRKNLLAIC